MKKKLSYGQKLKLDLLLPHLKKGHKILDLGCGSMWLTKILRKKGYNCIGMDVYKPADVIGDIKSHSFKKKSFDVVIALEMIEHVNCFEEIRDLLKKNGLLILSTPVPHFDWLCWINERLGLFQKRTSPHVNLFYLKDVPFKPIVKKNIFGIVQFGVFKK